MNADRFRVKRYRFRGKEIVALVTRITCVVVCVVIAAREFVKQEYYYASVAAVAALFNIGAGLKEVVRVYRTHSDP